MHEKKSFVLHFDAYPLLAMLPLEQRGLLLSAVYTYAMQVAQEPEASTEDVLRQFPQMTADTRMACGFICNAIRRDTGVWRRHKEARVQRRRLEQEAKRETAKTAGEDAWKYI